MAPRKYAFTWNLLGNMAEGRPNLGNDMPLEIYRLMQLTLRDVLEQRYGAEQADAIFFAAGKLAGTEFHKNRVAERMDLGLFTKKIPALLQEMKVGIVRIEELDIARGLVILTIAEDLDCSGMPELGYGSCVYDEGFLAGLLESATGRSFSVKEIDCWCTGERICRFKAEMVE